MDRTAFEYLYLHANSIAELGLRRAISRALLAPTPEPNAAQVAAIEELGQALTNPSEATFDWSALEGIEGFDPVGAEARPVPTDLIPESFDFGNPSDAPNDRPTTDPFGFSEAAGEPGEDGVPDVGRYLANVEAARAMLQVRISDGFARADHAAIEAALATLPSTLSGIAAPLSTDDFTRWLELYEARHAGLEAVVMEIRKLDPQF